MPAGTGRVRAVEYYRVKEPFVCTINGEVVSAARGDLVHPDHPILKGREEFFELARDHVRFNVEQATAAPGERRGDRE